MKKEYGITVENIPWYIKCPILNRLCDTAGIVLSAETYDEEGKQKCEIRGYERIQIEGRDLDWKAYLHLLFKFPSDGVGFGLRVRTTVYSVNNRPLTTPLTTELWVVPKEQPWYIKCPMAVSVKDAYIELKLGKKDLAERGVE